MSGLDYYRKGGFTKSLLLHLMPKTHAALIKIARYEERAMQVIGRRAIEQFVVKRLKEIEQNGGFD